MTQPLRPFITREDALTALEIWVERYKDDEEYTIDDVISWLSLYIHNNYEHNFYLEVDDGPPYFPFLYEAIQR